MTSKPTWPSILRMFGHGGIFFAVKQGRRIDLRVCPPGCTFPQPVQLGNMERAEEHPRSREGRCDMAGKDGLLRLQSRLLARRDALRKALAGDWESDRRFTAANDVGDTVDAVLDSTNDEINWKFAEIESRELEHVEHALQRILEGVYGRCEYCGQRIAATRLNALPYTNSCIDCQRENEQSGTEYGSGVGARHWARAYEKPNPEESGRDSTIRLRDLEMDLSDAP